MLVGYAGNSFAPLQTDAGWKYGVQTRRLLTFVLGGTAKLAPMPPADRALHAVDDPAYQVVESDLVEGYRLYTRNCSVCHGSDVVSGNTTAPDLREAAVPLDGDGFWTVVHEGPLRPAGMPRFAELSRAEVDKIRNYIRATAREALGLRKPAHYDAIESGAAR